eukprot:TRINITY_DN6377_c0_g1_i1.p1 TRINITY_DN6377_c0_g1~~TRINITY_DN6377_c0_g1_i1.p1  ORF type:complete len:170 (-),score=50.71 TRINITY_DN6377_c0_g1_i1:56-565(-)
MMAGLPLLLACLLCASSAAALSSPEAATLVKLPREFQAPQLLGEAPSEEDPSVDEASAMRNTTEQELVPVDLEKMIEESKVKAVMVEEALNALTAAEVNASNVYARWDETKAELMQVNKQFPIDPIVKERYPTEPDPPDTTQEERETLGLEPEGGDGDAEEGDGSVWEA